MWERETDVVAADWLKQGKFMSHDCVNELVTLMGQDVRKKMIRIIKSIEPAWYSLIEDEVTDVAY